MGCGSGLAVASVGARAGAAEPPVALRAGDGAPGPGPQRDPRDLPGGARVSAVSPGDDDGAAAVLVHAGRLLLAPDLSRLRGARGLHGGDCTAEAGLPHGERVPPPA